MTSLLVSRTACAVLLLASLGSGKSNRQLRRQQKTRKTTKAKQSDNDKSSNDGKTSTDTKGAKKSSKKGSSGDYVFHEFDSTTDHHLVGLWEYGYLDAASAPDLLSLGLVSGTKLDGVGGTPFDFIPSVGCTSLIPFMNAQSEVERGEYFCLARGGYGTRDNSIDYGLHYNKVSISTTFNFGQDVNSSSSPFQTATLTDTYLFTDKDDKLLWEGGIDLSLEYYLPDASWSDYSILRVPTGSDFSPQGMVIMKTNHAILADGYSPLLFSFNPEQHPDFLTNFVRVPDITDQYQLHPERKAVSANDKVFCNVDSLEDGECGRDIREIPGLDYKLVKAGFGGLAHLEDNSIVGIFQQTQDDEPGARVYRIDPCKADCPPSVTEFIGFVEFEPRTERISDVSPIPGSSTRVAIIENGPIPPDDAFPRVPGTMPVSRLCIVNLDSNDIELEKLCVLDMYKINDPFDIDNNNRYKYGQSRVRNGAVRVLDEYCVLASADSAFPFHSIGGIGAEVSLTLDHFMMICFDEALFSDDHPMFSNYEEAFDWE